MGVDRAAGHAVAGLLVDRQGFAGEHGFIDLAVAFHDLAIHGHPFAGADDHEIAYPDGVDRHIAIDPVAAHPRGGGAQGLQGADRCRGLAFGACLQPLAEQHQADHHCRCLEIQMHAVGTGEQQIHAQAIGRAGAHRHQQIHVAAAGAQRFPAGAIKTRAEPELHRRGQGHLQPAGQHPVRAEQIAEHGRCQRQRQQDRQRDRPPARQGSFRGGKGLTRGLRQVRAISGALDCGNEGGRRNALRHLDRGLLGRQVDAGVQHARHLAERLFHARRATGAGHAGDVEGEGFGRHAEAGLFDGALNGGHIGLARNGRGLGRQIDGGLGDAGQLLEHFFHARRATGAGHALDADCKG